MSAVEVLCVRLPVKVVSVMNAREHFMARARRAKAHRGLAALMLRGTRRKPPAGVPVEVVMTRIAPRELDGDNNQAGCKALRDGVADWLGLDDNNPLVTWKYAQRRGPPKNYECEIVVRWEVVA